MTRAQQISAAAKRLADHIGFKMTSAGNAWVLTGDDGIDYAGTMNGTEALGHLLQVALWSRPAGPGLSALECARIMKLELTWRPGDSLRGFDPKRNGWPAQLIVHTLRTAERQEQGKR